MAAGKRRRGGAAQAAERDPGAERADPPEKPEEEEGDAEDSLGTIVVGTYDGALLGLNVEDGSQVFGYAPHQGCIKALHCNKKGLLASGGTDNSVRLYDVARRVEQGELIEHEDTISCSAFWGTTTLVTCDSGGLVCIWRTGDWGMKQKFRAHKEGVVCVAIHPSGRLMATAGRDRTLRLWDLIRGTSAANLAVADIVETLEWSPDGRNMAALNAKELLLVDALHYSLAHFRDPGSTGLVRISLTAMMFLGEDSLLLGDGKGDLRVLERGGTAESPSLAEVCKLPVEGAARSRVKALARGLARPWDGLFAAGASDGAVEVWTVEGQHSEPEAYSRLWVVQTQVRLTCLSMFRVDGVQESWVQSEAAKAFATELEALGLGGARKARRRKGAPAPDAAEGAGPGS